MSNISRMMSVTLKENMAITDIIDILKHVETECNKNNMYLHTDKVLNFIDEYAFKPIKQQPTELQLKEQEIAKYKWKD